MNAIRTDYQVPFVATSVTRIHADFGFEVLKLENRLIKVDLSPISETLVKNTKKQLSIEK